MAVKVRAASCLFSISTRLQPSSHLVPALSSSGPLFADKELSASIALRSCVSGPLQDTDA